VTSVIRDVPRGQVSAAGSEPFDPGDNELLYGYPFGGGDLFGGNTAWSLSTPLVIVQRTEGDCVFLSSLDDRVRAKRFFFQPGEPAYRLEAVFEAEGWKDQTTLRVPTWRLGRAASLDQAVQAHYGHLERAYHLEPWETRRDMPDWARRTALVVTLHGMHYTGYVFNDYARMLEIARWVAMRIPPDRVLLFLPAWDGRYYWDYPLYRASDRLGGEAGLKRLVQETQRLGYRVMPMFGANAANRRQPVFARMADAATHKIDADRFDVNWVDWDNDRHQEGWLSYMNLGVASWRDWLSARIADVIERYHVDAYFLDIAGAWHDPYPGRGGRHVHEPSVDDGGGDRAGEAGDVRGAGTLALGVPANQPQPEDGRDLAPWLRLEAHRHLALATDYVFGEAILEIEETMRVG